MPRTSYPVAADLQSALEEADLFDAAFANSLTGACEATAAAWDEATDWGPFLAQAAATTRRFTVRGSNLLRFESGLCLAPEQVLCEGVALVEGQTYWLEPEAAPEWKKPYTRMRFARALQTRTQGLAITGRWGFCTELPFDVWNANLAKSALELRVPIERSVKARLLTAQNSVVKAKESGPLRVEYATSDGTKALDLGATFTAWQTLWDGAIERRRFRL